MSLASAFTWVITRPQPDANAWAAALISRGYSAIACPCINITPTIDGDLPANDLSAINDAAHIIITSPNAVRFCPSHVLPILRQKQAHIMTMGQGTSSALMQHGIQPAFTAPKGATSEKVLDSDFLQANLVQDKQIVLLSGLAGRDVFEQKLAQRAARVKKIAVYQRCCPETSPLLSLHTGKNIRYLFVFTSQSALANLWQLSDVLQKAWLQQQMVLVVSQRIATAAKALGFHQIINVNTTHLPDMITHLNTAGK